MASSEVDQKFLGKLAKSVENENPLLAQMLFKILGLSVNLADKLIAARMLRRAAPARPLHYHHRHRDLELGYHIIWLAREGLGMLEQYVLPWAAPTQNAELVVLVCKLRASFLHVYVLFCNQPANAPAPDILAGPTPPSTKATAAMSMSGQEYSGEGGGGRGWGQREENEIEYDDGDDDDDDDDDDNYDEIMGYPVVSSVAGSSGVGGGVPVGLPPSMPPSMPPPMPPPPPGFGFPPPTLTLPMPLPFSVLAKAKPVREADYLPTANEYFKTAVRLADELLWGSHSLRLSVKTEYAAFLYECAHDAEASRQLARDTITEVYEAQEGMSDDMFEDACELVAVLGKMKRRGRRGSGEAVDIATAPASCASVLPGMENAI